MLKQTLSLQLHKEHCRRQFEVTKVINAFATTLVHFELRACFFACYIVLSVLI